MSSSIFKNIACLVTLGAVSSCTLGCASVMHPLHSNDTNLAVLQLKQQETFARIALRNLSGSIEQCSPEIKTVEKEKEYSCEELQDLVISKCEIPIQYELKR
eukprot:GHVU01214652.1.p1 GENE.GHVU01214652.1~~GHVU01214652.1.p1  ORF type:complete len:102 (-),score=5.47 GHVU01214652.1:158-463(-)